MVLMLCAAPLAGQDKTPADSSAAPADSREQLQKELPPGFMDSTTSIMPEIREVRRKSPGGALLRSLALPGWGQFYTEHRIRGAVTAVAESAFLAGMVIKFRDRDRLRDRLSSLEQENGPEWPVDDPLRVQLNSQIKSVQQKGGDYLAYGATALVLGMLDAYVSAHLYNFDRHFVLAPTGSGRITLAFRF